MKTNSIFCPHCGNANVVAQGVTQGRCGVCGKTFPIPQAVVQEKSGNGMLVLVIVLATVLAAMIGAMAVYFLTDRHSTALEPETVQQPLDVHDTVRETQTIVRQVPAARPAPAATSSHIEGLYPFTSTRRVSASELYAYSADELKIMRNEIYARHGYIFQTADMKSYFAAQPWYRPVSRNVRLTAIEQANVATIKRVEAAM